MLAEYKIYNEINMSVGIEGYHSRRNVSKTYNILIFPTAPKQGRHKVTGRPPLSIPNIP